MTDAARGLVPARRVVVVAVAQAVVGGLFLLAAALIEIAAVIAVDPASLGLVDVEREALATALAVVALLVLLVGLARIAGGIATALGREWGRITLLVVAWFGIVVATVFTLLLVTAPPLEGEPLAPADPVADAVLTAVVLSPIVVDVLTAWVLGRHWSARPVTPSAADPSPR